MMLEIDFVLALAPTHAACFSRQRRLKAHDNFVNLLIQAVRNRHKCVPTRAFTLLVCSQMS